MTERGATGSKRQVRAAAIGWMLAFGVAALGYQADSQQAASIEGHVIAQTTGSPLKNAVVRLRKLPIPARQSVSNQMLQQTNEDGHFLFANVPVGDWELSADRRGFITGKYKASKYDPQGSPLAVKANEPLRDLVLTLLPQGVIAGRVLTAEGEPVEGARVNIIRISYSKGIPLWSHAGSALTLDNGEYRVPRVAAGRYLIKSGITEVNTAGLRLTYPATYYPGATEASTAVAVDVRPDGEEIKGIDIRISPTPVFHVRGSLRPPDGLQDMGRVVLFNKDGQFSIFAERTVDRSGYMFHFDRVPPGSYLLYASYRDRLAVTAVDVKEHDVENLLISPTPNEIWGSLKLRPGGRQVDLRNLSVTIQPLGPERRLVHFPGPAKISNDFTFGYALTWGDGPTFQVNVSKIPEGCYIASVQYGGREVLEPVIEYVSGAALEITIGSDGAVLDGRVLGSDEHPWEGAVVALISADGKTATRSMKSGPQGFFRFNGVPPGEYRIIAWDDVTEDDLQNPEFVSRFEKQGTAVTLDPSGAGTASVRVMIQDTTR